MQVSDVMPDAREGIDWVSYSSIGLQRECPQAWHYKYLLGLSKMEDPDDAKVELNFGIWWHALRAADALERGWKYDSLLFEPKKLGVPGGEVRVMRGYPMRDLVLEAAQVWQEHLSEEHKALWTQKLGEQLPERLAALDRRWYEHHGEHEGEIDIERPLAVECKWVRKVPGMEKELVGYVDEIYLDTKRNIVVARDYKSMKDIGSQNAEDDMMDSQLQLYAWGMQPQLAEHGVKISAVSYDRVKSVKATTPRLTQAGALSKQVTQFDLLSYRDWVAEGQEYPGRAKDGSQAGVYEEDPNLIEQLDSPVWRSKWFQRTRVPLNKNLIRAHLQAAVDSTKAIDVTIEQVQRRGEAPRNLKSACKWCDYVKLCRAQMMGGPEGEYPLGDFGLVGPER